MTTVHSLCQAIIATARRLNDSGLTAGSSGNVSVRIEDGFLVTPTGMSYAALAPADIVRVDSDGAVAPGQRLPSSEWRFHRDIYGARPEAGAIVHVHSPYATALACLRRAIPAFHYMVAIAGGDSIRCAPYATFGTQALSAHVVAALAGRRACLLANHGLVAFAGDLEAAFGLAAAVEDLARQYCLCLSMGEPVLLDAGEMQRVLAKFASYGAQPPKPGSDSQ